MERHLSTGVATIVALMAAHRLAAEQDGSASLAHAVAQINARLARDELRMGRSSRAISDRVIQTSGGSAFGHHARCLIA